ncbi:MAG: hypothetical protein E7360_01220 [Clostridiales bacterium]|nr:hypothetical protein [Clostridiales bacterium]
MQLKYGVNEVVLKSWDYAKAGNAMERDKKNCSLVVTNKRIISSIEDKKSLHREEIPLSEVHGIEGNFKHNKSIWTVIKLIIGIIWSITIIGLILGGIKMIKSAIAQMRACVFNLVITTNGGNGDPLSIGAKGAAAQTRRFHFFSRSVNKFKVYVDKDVAREILDEIGSVVLDVKER